MAKIHRATVTKADLNYVGSITIDEALLEKSGIRPFQYVNITNVSNGVFWAISPTPKSYLPCPTALHGALSVYHPTGSIAVSVPGTQP